jgi:hypothetical protein
LSSTERVLAKTVSFPLFAVTRSGELSPLRSAAATQPGPTSVRYAMRGSKLASPRFMRATVSASLFDATRSRTPSPLTSAAATDVGPRPVVNP